MIAPRRALLAAAILASLAPHRLTLAQPVTQPVTQPADIPPSPRADAPAPEATAPIRVLPRSWTLEGKPARGFIATVNLADPRVEVLVTAPAAYDGIEAVLIPTDQWHVQAGAVLSINANFFSKSVPDSAARALPQGVRASDIIGLSKTDGVLVSPPRTSAGSADPALLFFADGTARALPAAPEDAAPAVDAVAGVGPGSGDDLPGTLLVTAGTSTGATARVEPLQRHPRTAAGVSRDGRTLILAVIDGRQPDWSVGVTLPELADILIEAGAWDAINLDGGGSTSLVFTPSPGERTVNRPSDGAFRPVANHLGIRLRDAAPSGPAITPGNTPADATAPASPPERAPSGR